MLTNQLTTILLTLFFIPVLSSGITAQEHPQEADQKSLLELKKVQNHISQGPHYKNPNAAGRLLLFNRTAPTASVATKKAPLIGPAYKNRKPQPVVTDQVPATTQRPLTGPRYKNRRAKSSRQQ